MRKFALPIVILAGLAAATGAQAATASTVEGLIKGVNLKAHTLTLKSGSVFKLAKGLKIASYKAGEKVKITWKKVGKVYEATAIVVE